MRRAPRRLSRLLAGLVAAISLSGCVYFRKEPRPLGSEGAWAEKRERATRGAKIYDRLGTNAFIKAVHLTAEVREARAARLAVWRALTAQEREELLAVERAEAGEYEDFMVSLFTPDRDANDLDAPKSVWRVALVVPGAGEALPDRIEQVKADATLRALYPDFSVFDVVYRVRFGRSRVAIEGRPFTLRLAGAKGRADLVF
jgi:hypothetical protein